MRAREVRLRALGMGAQPEVLRSPKFYGAHLRQAGDRRRGSGGTVDGRGLRQMVRLGVQLGVGGPLPTIIHGPYLRGRYRVSG